MIFNFYESASLYLEYTNRRRKMRRRQAAECDYGVGRSETVRQTRVTMMAIVMMLPARLRTAAAAAAAATTTKRIRRLS